MVGCAEGPAMALNLPVEIVSPAIGLWFLLG